MMAAYHYTNLIRLPFLLSDGFIKPSRHIRALQRPDAGRGVTWCTTCRRGDPTASVFHDPPVAPKLRLVVPLAATMVWHEACRQAGWSEADIAHAADTGRRYSAKVDLWRAVPGPVSIAELLEIEISRPGDTWRPMPEMQCHREGDTAVAAFEGVTYTIARRRVPVADTLAYKVTTKRGQGILGPALQSWQARAA
jgi:hypothetical protein